MDKPLTVRADEFSQSVVYLANNSGLPAFILANVLDGLSVELKELAKDQLRADNDVWNKYQEEQERKGADNDQTTNSST